MRVVVEPTLLLQGFASPGSDTARLLTLLEFGAAASAVHEAEELQGRFSGSAARARDLAQALARWEPLHQRLPPPVMDDWELAMSEPLLLETQQLVGEQPSLGLDAEEVYDELLRRHVSALVPLEQLEDLRSELAQAGQETSDLAEVALAAGAGCVIASRPMFVRARSKPSRFSRRRGERWIPGTSVEFRGRQTLMHTLQSFKDDVLPFPLQLVDDRARA